MARAGECTGVDGRGDAGVGVAADAQGDAQGAGTSAAADAQGDDQDAGAGAGPGAGMDGGQGGTSGQAAPALPEAARAGNLPGHGLATAARRGRNPGGRKALAEVDCGNRSPTHARVLLRSVAVAVGATVAARGECG